MKKKRIIEINTYSQMTEEMKKKECKHYIELFADLKIFKTEVMKNKKKMFEYFEQSEGNPIRMIELITREIVLGI